MPPWTRPKGWWWSSLSDSLARTRVPVSSWMRNWAESRMYWTAAPDGRGSIRVGASSVTHPAYERGEHLVGRLEMRAVPAGNDEPLDRSADERLHAVELVERAVRVVGALHQQHGAGDALRVGLQAPVAEGGIEPDVAPAVEGGRGIVVVTGHPLAQLPAVEGLTRLADGRDRDVLDHHVRGEQRDARHRVLAGMDERDRTAVTVTDEDGPRGVEPREHLGQDLEGLLVEERRGPGARRRLGAPVAVAGEGEHPPARRRLQGLRELAPQADRSEPLVQEHERALAPVARQFDRLQPAPGDGQRPVDDRAGHAVTTSPGHGVSYSRATG